MQQRFEAQEQAKAALKLAAERMKWYYDKGVQNIPWKVGDNVMLDLRDYQTTERALQPRYEGPFKVIEKLSPVTFKLELPSKYRSIHPVFHAIKLATYNEPTIVGQKGPTPAPVVVNGEEEWVVEKILQHRVRRKKVEYLVRWKGFTRDHDSWEPAGNLKNAQERINEYKKENFETAVIESDKVFSMELESEEGVMSQISHITL